MRKYNLLVLFCIFSTYNFALDFTDDESTTIEEIIDTPQTKSSLNLVGAQMIVSEAKEWIEEFCLLSHQQNQHAFMNIIDAHFAMAVRILYSMNHPTLCIDEIDLRPTAKSLKKFVKIQQKRVCGQRSEQCFLEIIFPDNILFTQRHELLSLLIPLLEPLAENHHIMWLSLCSNQLHQLPKEIACLNFLETLALSGNQLSALPQEIIQLKNLKTLHLSQNYFDHVPSFVWELSNLEFLAISECKLNKLSPQIIKLKKLKTLLIHENQLYSLPNELCSLENLKMLCARDNKFQTNPLPQLSFQIGTNNFVYGDSRTPEFQKEALFSKRIKAFVNNGDGTFSETFISLHDLQGDFQ
ncbi:MAG: leucine-rich repeat domain-containing protein [Myxococcales bacterium]|nr:leucine-rich repeat domain-containing protein [Myxococcales bacterium]USN51797.1 MAG: leucine-rich repeat domain-containing protein [Myxococcales bacterium]